MVRLRDDSVTTHRSPRPRLHGSHLRDGLYQGRRRVEDSQAAAAHALCLHVRKDTAGTAGNQRRSGTAPQAQSGCLGGIRYPVSLRLYLSLPLQAPGYRQADHRGKAQRHPEAQAEQVPEPVEITDLTPLPPLRLRRGGFFFGGVAVRVKVEYTLGTFNQPIREVI